MGDVNRELTPARFDAIEADLQTYLAGREIFVQDCRAGADYAI